MFTKPLAWKGLIEVRQFNCFQFVTNWFMYKIPWKRRQLSSCGNLRKFASHLWQELQFFFTIVGYSQILIIYSDPWSAFKSTPSQGLVCRKKISLTIKLKRHVRSYSCVSTSAQILQRVIVVGSSDKIYIDLNYSRKKDVFVVSQSSHFSLLHEFANSMCTESDNFKVKILVIMQNFAVKEDTIDPDNMQILWRFNLLQNEYFL